MTIIIRADVATVIPIKCASPLAGVFLLRRRTAVREKEEESIS